MTNVSYLRGLTDEQLFSVYSAWVEHRGRTRWNEQIMSELRRRGAIRKAKTFHKNRTH